MKTCRFYRKQLTAYAHGELADARAHALERHLEGCADCRAALEAQQAALALLDEALAAAPAAAELNPWRPLRRSAPVPGNRFEQIWYSPQLKGMLAAAALAVLFILISGGVVVFRVLPKKQEPLVVSVAPAAPDADRDDIHIAVNKRTVPRTEPRPRSHSVSPSRKRAAEEAAMPTIATLTDGPGASAETAFEGFALTDVRYERQKTLPRGRVDAEPSGWLPENAFMAAMDYPLSTFSMDVDRTAYADVRRFLNDNRLPPPEAIRIEEMINYFAYDYPEPEGDDPFAIALEVADCPWNGAHQLALVGLQGVKVKTRDLPPNNLVFLLDVSDSMNASGKLPLLTSALRLLTDQLRSEDRVSIVVYAGAAGLVLEPTSDKARIEEAIQRLQAGGSTAGGAGIELAYKTAQESFVRNGNNRVILATDGDFNVGASSDGELLRLIEKKRASGVCLTVLGFGTGSRTEATMERLADTGRGNYAAIDDVLEAKKVLVNEMGGTLLTIAKDVKIQVEFNPAQVKAYRLIGYENRAPASEDVNAGRMDAGELGAGHTVTALYELIPTGSGEPVPDELKYTRSQWVGRDELMTVKLRYKHPDSAVRKLQVRSANPLDFEGRVPSENFRFASEVAEFGLLLRNSEFKGMSSYEGVIRRAGASRGADFAGDRAEFIRLVEKARLLERAGDD